MQRTIFGRLVAAFWLVAVPVSASVLVEDTFDGASGAPPAPARFVGSGEASLNGSGQLYLSTWTASTSWLRSQVAIAPAPGESLVLQFRASAYAEPAVYGDQQPRGLRVGTDANNVAEFYSVYGTTLGMRVKANSVQTLVSCPFPSGVQNMHDYEISLTTTSVVFRVDGLVVGNITENIPTGPLNAFFCTYDGGFGNVPLNVDSLSLVLDQPVTGVAPSIDVHPESVTVLVTSNAAFSVSASGTAPLSYQWFHFDDPIVGATAPQLSLTNVFPDADGGLYTVVVANDYGSVTSEVAVLTVNLVAQDLVFPPLGVHRVGDAPFSVSAVASSGLPVAYSSSDHSVATTLNNVITIVGPGTTTIMAFQDGNTFYLPAAAMQELTVLPHQPAGAAFEWTFNQRVQGAIPDGLSNVVSLALGDSHTVALKSDGSLVSWGSNDAGQLGFPADLNNVVAVSAAKDCTVLLHADGTVSGWGTNLAGPVTAPPGLSSIRAISAGPNHVMALRQDSTVSSWGVVYGSPPGSLTDVIAIAAGGSHSLALQSNGVVVAWGSNDCGQASVPVTLSGVVSIAAGDSHSVAVRSDGRVVVWGDNSFGQRTVPLYIPEVARVSASGALSAALCSNGSLFVWGSYAPGLYCDAVQLSGVVGVTVGPHRVGALVPLSPQVFWNPVGMGAMVGQNATFSAVISGVGPFSYHWSKDGAPLAWATGPTLVLTNVQSSDAAFYRLVVTNAYGYRFAAAAPLSVQQPYDYTVVDGVVRITGYDGPGGTLVVPGSIDGYPVGVIEGSATGFERWAGVTNLVLPPIVTRLGQFAFYPSTSLVSISLPDSLLSIDASAFASCSALRSVVIPNSVTNIAQSAFWNCTSLSSIQLSTNLVSLGGAALSRCFALRHVDLPVSLCTIGPNAFDQSGLVDIVLPPNVSFSGSMVFSSCPALQAVYCEGSPPAGPGGNFDAFSTATVYYVPGTPGWDAVYDTRPTAAWLPRLTGASGAPGAGFGFGVNWARGQMVVVEASSDFGEWTPVYTNLLSNNLWPFADLSWTNAPKRFYRVRAP